MCDSSPPLVSFHTVSSSHLWRGTPTSPPVFDEQGITVKTVHSMKKNARGTKTYTVELSSSPRLSPDGALVKLASPKSRNNPRSVIMDQELSSTLTNAILQVQYGDRASVPIRMTIERTDIVTQEKHGISMTGVVTHTASPEKHVELHMSKQVTIHVPSEAMPTDLYLSSADTVTCEETASI